MRTPTLQQAVKAALLAPLAALSVVAVVLLVFDENHDFGFGLPTLALLAYFLIVCYAAELLFVIPGLALRPSFRQPHPAVASAYGILVAWSLPAFRWIVEGHGSESLPLASVAGGASGLLYSVLIRRLGVAGENRPASARACRKAATK